MKNLAFFTKIYFNDLLKKFKIYIHNIKFFKLWYFNDFYKKFFNFLRNVRYVHNSTNIYHKIVL